MNIPTPAHATVVAAALFGLLSVPAVAPAQTAPIPSLITQPVNNGQFVTLSGNTRPLARPGFDRGAAPASLPMQRMLLVLKRSPQQQAELDRLLQEQQEKSSPNYHRWLTPEEFGQRFGLNDQDLQKVTSWLESQGFQIDEIAKGRTAVEFSGTAAQVGNSFQTAIHKFVVNGTEHWANVSDPRIPAALVPGVAGIASLHNFISKPQVSVLNQRMDATLEPGAPSPQFTSGGSHLLAPADYATIYNINPAYQAGINGSGTVIAIVGRSNINVQDVVSFRSIFGLSNNPPHVVVNGADPGNLGGGEEVEAVLDTTWAGAVAPNAQVDLVVSATTNSTDGVFLSEQYIINNNLANVMTESFGDCEANYTSAEAANISSMAQQAAAEGITYMVSSGDAGSAGCDNFDSESSATGPISVNVLASTPYTIAVGGTQFNDSVSPAQYWNSANGVTGGSALSYIPEDVWNANCTGSSCGSGSILAGGGGVSHFFSKPSWQAGVAGIPSDGARDVPDVALAAAGHTPYVLCLDGSCTPQSSGQVSLYGVYGTSAAAPSFAGIMALVNQKTGSRQGQANAVLYKLAAAENLSNCNASNTSGLPSSNCIFNDVTVGTNAVPGEPGYNTSGETYLATAGYDLASGLGSVNVGNLINGWTGGVSGGSTFTISGQITSSGVGLGGVTVSLSNGFTSSTVTASSGSYSFSGLAGGATYTVTPSLSGYSFNPASQTFSNLSANQTANFTATSTTPAAVARIGVARPSDSNFGNLLGWYLDKNGSLQLDSGDQTGGFGLPGDIPIVGDWTGNGHTSIGVFRNNDSNCSGGIGWYLDVNGDMVWDGGDRAACFGLAGDVPIMGDWNGDGVTKVGVYRMNDPRCGGGIGWYLDINGNYVWDAGDRATCFGLAGDTPIVGHWTASAVTKIAVYRLNDPNCAGGIGWYFDTNGSFQWDSGDQGACFGLAGDHPVTGDWNGNGITKLGVTRPNDPNFSGNLGWYLDTNGNLTWDSRDQTGGFGLSSDTPIAGDWDGSGTTRIGVFRPTDASCSGQAGWYLDNGSLQYGAGDHHGCFGMSADKPIIGTW